MFGSRAEIAEVYGNLDTVLNLVLSRNLYPDNHALDIQHIVPAVYIDIHCPFFRNSRQGIAAAESSQQSGSAEIGQVPGRGLAAKSEPDRLLPGKAFIPS